VDFLSDFGMRDTFQERIAPKSLKIEKNKLHVKFSAFDDLSLDFQGSRKPAHEDIKNQYPRKSR